MGDTGLQQQRMPTEPAVLPGPQFPRSSALAPVPQCTCCLPLRASPVKAAQSGCQVYVSHHTHRLQSVQMNIDMCVWLFFIFFIICSIALKSHFPIL